jgi:ribonuclease VapC
VIVDTSAVVPIVRGEAHGDQLAEVLLDATAPKMSAATLAEVNAVLIRRLRPEDQRRVERLSAVWEIEIVPFDAEQAGIASRAYRDFGRGSGHPAALNLGDAAPMRSPTWVASPCCMWVTISSTPTSPPPISVEPTATSTSAAHGRCR